MPRFAATWPGLRADVEHDGAGVEGDGMDPGKLRLAVLVLAAGAGSRFSPQPGAKLLADLDGRPVLAHVLDAVRSFGPEATVAVLGHGEAEIERSIHWQGELQAINPAPERGLASSLQVGIRALGGLPQAFDGAFVVLGDQPRLQPAVMRALAEAATSEGRQGRPLLVPRYTDEPGPRNPVLLMRSAWGWVDGLEGDRGLATLIDSRPASVLSVAVDGGMPDVDDPADLARLRTGPG
jgi:molybdenum cofactor cytidylyltransferase